MKREANGEPIPVPALAIAQRLERAALEIQHAMDECGSPRNSIAGPVAVARCALVTAYMREALFFALKARQAIAEQN